MNRSSNASRARTGPVARPETEAELSAAGERLIQLVEEAERAFAGQPKALWSDRTYLSPKDAGALRALISALSVPSGWVLAPLEPSARMLAAAVMSAVAGEPDKADYGITGAVLELLPPTGHPDARTVIAEISRDYRAALRALAASPRSGTTGHPDEPNPNTKDIRQAGEE